MEKWSAGWPVDGECFLSWELGFTGGIFFVVWGSWGQLGVVNFSVEH